VSLTTSLGALLEAAQVPQLLGHTDRANAARRLAAWQVEAREKAAAAEDPDVGGGYRLARQKGEQRRRGGRVKLARSRYRAVMLSGGPLRR